MIAQQFFVLEHRTAASVLKKLRRDVTHHQRKKQLVVYYVKLRKDHSILGSTVTVTRAAQVHGQI